MNKRKWLTRAFVLLFALLGSTLSIFAQGPENDVRLGEPPTPPQKVTSQPISPMTPSHQEGGLTVNPQNRQESLNFYQTNYLPSEGIEIGWTGNHGSCNAGTTSQAFRDAITSRINYFRAMAGVPANITLNETYNSKAQQAALMMSVNRQLDHNPPANWTCYTADGAEAAAKSNLAGISGPKAITAYIQDPGAGNDFVGHRRQILYPQTQQMGSGDVPAASPNTESNALWVFDGNLSSPRPNTREEYVAWPPPGYVPSQVVFARWSFSYPNADFSNATVSMTSSGSNIPVEKHDIRNGYGENTLVWIPNGLADNAAWPQPSADTTYKVTVSNVLINGTARTFEYDVTVFDVTGATPTPAATSTSVASSPTATSTPVATSSPTATASPTATSAPGETPTAVPTASPAEWTSVFAESFDTFPSGNWQVANAAGVDTAWGATAHDNDAEINPQSTKSAWPAAGGGSPVDPASGNYPNNQKSWMYYGPLDLSDAKSAEVWFSLKYNIEEEGDDWLGFCIGTGITDPSALESDDDCYWWQGASDQWADEFIPIHEYAGKSDVYIGWLFESDDNNAANHAGPFIDEVEVLTNPLAPDEIFAQDFADWTKFHTSTFDEVDLANSPQWTLKSNMTGNTWVTTDSKNDDYVNPDSTHSASAVTPGNGYPNGLESWMIYGPVDLSNYVEADVDFSVYYDLVFNDDDDENNDDWLGFCVSTSNDPSTFNLETCDWWKDSSQGDWEDAFVDLTPYAGQSEVYLAWYFDSNNGSANKEGAFVDEISIWGLHKDADIPDINFENNGLLIQNGTFDNNLQSWSAQNVGSGTGSVVTTQMDTNTVASMSGDQYLYQAFDVAEDTVDLLLSYDYALSTTETVLGEDQYCITLTANNDPSDIKVHLGCFEPLDVPETARDGKQLYNFTVRLNDVQLSQVQGKNVALTFELAQDRGGTGAGTTMLLLDNITIYATGKAGRNPASGLARRSPQEDGTANQRDQNEPNDVIDQATSISCGQTIAGVFGDVGGGGTDDEWFKVSRVPIGQFVLDIDARSKRPVSTADTFLFLHDSQGDPIDHNDDDGQTADSRLVYNNTTADATYYISVDNLTESGAEAFYDLKVECQQQASSSNNNENAPTPQTPQTQDNQKAWTMILYLNGEDQKCITDPSRNENDCWDKAYEKAIKEMEAYIAEKQEFLNVVVLLDGPNYGGVASDVRRYVVQPNGNYTENVNKWMLPEANMGDPKTFVDFVKWAQTNYPAKNYYLSIDDHGNGVYGVSTDHHDAKGKIKDDTLTPAELHSAMKEITKGGKNPIQVFDYEACLMGMAENAYDLKDFAQYVAFFQSISWTTPNNPNYPRYFKDLQANDNALTVGKRVIQNYPVTSNNTPYTFALVDSSKMTTVREKVDAFATALMSADLNQVNAARNKSQAFNGKPERGKATQANNGYIDLWDLAHNVAAEGIAQSQAADVKSAVEAAVVAKNAVASGTESDGTVSDYSNAHGLSIYYPTEPYNSISTYCRSYQMSKDGKWDNFLIDKVLAPPPGYTNSFNCSATATSAQQRLAYQEGQPRLLNAPGILEPRLFVPEDPTAVDVATLDIEPITTTPALPIALGLLAFTMLAGVIIVRRRRS